MKYLILITSILLFSCSNNDDNIIPDPEEDKLPFLRPLVLSNDFLKDELWFYDEVTSDIAVDIDANGTENTNLLLEMEDCQIGSFFVFEKNKKVNDNSLILKYKISDFPCDSAVLSIFEDDEIPISNNLFEGRIIFEEQVNTILGQFRDLDSLDNIEVFIAETGTFKIIKGQFKQRLFNNSGDYTVSFTLKANASNRP